MRLIDAEIWKDISGYEGMYQISNLGKVRSVDRVVHGRNDYFQKGIELKIFSNWNYDFVVVSRNGKSKRLYLHRLVAEHFVENPNNYNVVNHKDENKRNNKADNLEWCTSKYNANYGKRNRKIAQKLGKRIARMKNGKILQVYSSQADAKRNGFSQSQISKCCNGKIKQHKGYEWKFV